MEKNKTSEDSIKILNRRSFIIIIFGAILSLIIALRLFSVQVINFNFYKKKSVENKLSIKLTPPLRGDIFDSKKNLLAGLHNGTAEYAHKMINKGFNLVTVGSDSRYITAGAKTDLEKLKGIKGSKSKGY